MYFQQNNYYLIVSFRVVGISSIPRIFRPPLLLLLLLLLVIPVLIVSLLLPIVLMSISRLLLAVGALLLLCVGIVRIRRRCRIPDVCGVELAEDGGPFPPASRQLGNVAVNVEGVMTTVVSVRHLLAQNPTDGDQGS